MGNARWALLDRASFDLVRLDVMLPGRDGFEVCRELRGRGLSLPVLMLTARAQVVDRVIGLKLGADDYLVKPFDMSELLARVEALLRRGRPAAGRAEGTFAFGYLIALSAPRRRPSKAAGWSSVRRLYQGAGEADVLRGPEPGRHLDPLAFDADMPWLLSCPR